MYIHHHGVPWFCLRPANAVEDSSIIDQQFGNSNVAVPAKDTDNRGSFTYHGSNATKVIDTAEAKDGSCHQALSGVQLEAEMVSLRAIISWLYRREREKIEEQTRTDKWSRISSKIDHILFIAFLFLTVGLMIICLLLTTLHRG